jgi:polynucleotide 5'-kinase involved in rRNA processing
VSEITAIRFQAQVFKVQTMIDGGIRLTLDLVEVVQPTVIVALFEAKYPGILLEVAALAVVKQKGNNAISEGPKRKSKWTSA